MDAIQVFMPYLCRFVCEQDKLFFLNYWAKALIVLVFIIPRPEGRGY